MGRSGHLLKNSKNDNTYIAFAGLGMIEMPTDEFISYIQKKRKAVIAEFGDHMRGLVADLANWHEVGLYDLGF